MNKRVIFAICAYLIGCGDGSSPAPSPENINGGETSDRGGAAGQKENDGGISDSEGGDAGAGYAGSGENAGGSSGGGMAGSEFGGNAGSDEAGASFGGTGEIAGESAGGDGAFGGEPDSPDAGGNSGTSGSAGGTMGGSEGGNAEAGNGGSGISGNASGGEAAGNGGDATDAGSENGGAQESGGAVQANGGQAGEHATEGGASSQGGSMNAGSAGTPDGTGGILATGGTGQGGTGTGGNGGTCNVTTVTVQAEFPDSASGGVWNETKLEPGNPVETTCIHIGPNNDDVNDGIGFFFSHDFEIGPACSDGMIYFLQTRYADDLGGNTFDILLDGTKIGQFETATTDDEADTDGWNTFVNLNRNFLIGSLASGTHTLTLTMTKGGSWGAAFDKFVIAGMRETDLPESAKRYLMNHQQGGLFSDGLDNGDWTSVYKNSLVAIAFILEGEADVAQGIFDFFATRYDVESFTGFSQGWVLEEGAWAEDSKHEAWIGDNAFLLIALSYYAQATGDTETYRDMTEGLAVWIASQAGEDIIAEGLANMYAALKPLEATLPQVPEALPTIRQSFCEKKAYDNTLDNIERAALVFSDLDGFAFLNEDFRITETWDMTGMPMTALKGFATDDFANIEITAQILLAKKIWGDAIAFDPSELEQEMDRLWIAEGDISASIDAGLPYSLTFIPEGEANEHFWDGASTKPVIDPTCYALFAMRGFNPMAPGKQGWDAPACD